jgi:amino acid adenylation domain-containing protein/non-ribosomal peptide synthase protein (TIGR01720 family)
MDSIVGYPLSPRQRHLWALLQDPGLLASDARALLRLRGPLDPDALAAALDALVGRHEILRTAFERLPGLPEALQVVEETGVRVEEPADLRSLSAEAREARVEALWREAGDAGPLPAARVIQADDGEHLLLLRVHPLGVDDASWEHLAADLAALYAAETGGEPVEGEPVPYVAVSEWLNEVGGSDEAQAGRAFWIRQLESPEAPLPAVSVDSADGVDDDAPVAARRVLPAELAAPLRALAEDAGAPAETVVLAAWTALLHRLGGGEAGPVRTGVAFDGRADEELRTAVGPFTQHLPVAVEVDAALPFRALVERLRDARDEAGGWQEAFDAPAAHRYLAGDDAAPDSTLRLRGGFTARPAAAEHAAGAVRITLTRRRAAEDPFALHLLAEEGADGFALELHAPGASPARLARLLERAEALLADALARPEAPLSALAVMSAAERGTVLGAWNDTATDTPYRPVHASFAARAAAAPQAVAVVSGDQSLTYAQLDARANALAAVLRGRGVGPDARVAVCLERSAELVVALLAVLKAGGAYVPLDPGYPAERLAFMLDDADVALLVTETRFLGLLGDYAGATVCLDRAGDVPQDAVADVNADVAAEGGEAVSADVHPAHLAYVIYTSGSTGRPKGVAVPHGALASQVAWMQRAYPLAADDRVLQKTPVSFDASVWEFWAPLLAGATLVVAGADAHRDPAELARAVEGGQVTVLQLVPSLLRAVLDTGALDGAPALRRLFCGGEALPAELAERARGTLAPEVVNLYGPTEVCIQSVVHTASSNSTADAADSAPSGSAAAGTVPIGRPVADVRAYVLDAAGEPVPAGVAGELYLGGVQLARGYLRRPALTGERFVPDPFGADVGGRLYRTGDRVRHQDDGTLVFLGRVDQQVKVRGFRIELGEVESALESHPAVRAAAALVREDAPGDARLVGYVAGEVDAEEVRTHLRRSLPEYMVPAAIVVLEALPLTSGGKLDRKALPAPAGAAEDRYVAPRTPVEEVLAGIWAEVLRMDRVGIHDDFFALGGHSLLGTKLISRVRSALRVEVPLRSLFEDPTPAALGRRVDALLRAGAEAEAPPIVPVPRDRPLPLSFAQQRLWFIQQLEPASVAYNMPYALRMRGTLDTDVLRRALDALVARHESLRTVFREQEGQPVQVVLPAEPVQPLLLDLSTLPADEREAELRRRVRAEAERPFDLATGPLLRVAVLRMDDDDAAVLFTLHHIVSDGWSRDILVREVSELYTAFAAGRAPVLPELPVQYADYAVWQRAWLSDGVLEGQLGYWRRRLAGAPPLLELPTDHARTAATGVRAGYRSFTLSPAASAALRALAREEGATLFMTLLAGYQALLARWSGQDDVVVGTPVAGRARLEVESVIGFLVNMLALRTDLSGDPTYRALVSRVRDGALEAYAHQDVPFEKLVDELQPGRSLTHAPLFQTVFSLQAAAGEEALRLGTLEVGRMGGSDEAAKFDLMLVMVDGGEQLGGTFIYRTDLFEAETVGRMAGHLQRVLEQVAADADAPLSRLDPLDPAERTQLVEAWNETARDYPSAICIHERFAEQARARPDAPALAWDDLQLTYAELDARANRLAHALRRRGVGPDARVGVLLERGAELIVSILAILKAGGCYVPLDPGYPAERLRLMLADCAARVLVTTAEHAEIGAEAGIPAVSLDADADAIAAESADAVESGATAENLAYIVYTSGSTGRPKGVMVSHRNVIQLVVGTDYVQLAPGDRVAQASNASFDALAFETWGALLNGATLVGIPRDVLLSPPRLRELLRDGGITTLYQTTALLNQLSREQPDIFAPLREVLFGGQAVDADSVRRILRSGKPKRLLHMYGPTETTAWCSYETVEAVAEDALTVSVGLPTGNQRIYVLDTALQPVPLGVAGEAYAGGEGIVRGYLDRPGLTAERFVPDPFSVQPGARMYRTGDRLRRRPDGALEFVGRLDDQVKIRGFRIEPGEVESALSAHPDVHEARVVVRGEGPEDRRLVAYVVGDADAAGLRAHLRQRLPEYMVPAAFVPLDRLPLTPSGKLDVQALPAPEMAPGEDGYVAPRTPAEQALAAIWAEVLRLERVGVDDGFFELGGDSILCIQVVSRARRAGVEITPRQMFEHQTIAGLAAVAGRTGGGDSPAAEQGRAEGRVALTPIQAWFLEQEPAAPAHHNQSVLLQVDAALDDSVLAAALAAVLEHHDALRLRFRRTDAGWEQFHAHAAGIELERVDLSGLGDAEQARAQAETAEARQASLDLEHGPVGRAVLFDRGERGRVLLLILHHLVVDGVSWRILRDDLDMACAQAERGEPVALGARTTSYQRWAEALQAYAASDALRAEAGYWLAQGTDGVAPLPAADGKDAAETVTVRLDAEETRALLQDVPAAYRTQVNDVLLCALADAVGGWTGTPRIRLALEGHGREEAVGEGIDLTRTVGWFTSLYPVVLDTAGAADPGARLMRVKEQLRAVPARGIGYGVLRYLGPAEVRDALAAQPEPEISFNYLGQVDGGTSSSHIPGAAERFRLAGGPRGRESAEGNGRRYTLEVNGAVVGGALQLSWSGAALGREAVERLAHAYLDALRALVAHCRAPGAGGVTPSDFPLAGLTQAELDAAVGDRRGVEDLYPLSPLQEGLLFHALYGGESQAYQVQAAHRLEGPLDAGLLRRAWAETVRRHAVLRTDFAWRGLRRPLQRVHAAVEVPWRVEDWRGRPEAEQDAALEAYLAEDRARGFALDEAPLLRGALFRVADDAHWLVWNQHHLLLDGWASARVMNEVFRLYVAWSTGEPVELPRVRPYRDYIAWVAAQDAGAAERYWRGVLAGFGSPTPLGVDWAAAADGPVRQDKRGLSVDADLTRRLEEAARAARVTLNTVLQGAWALLLSRYGGGEDVVFGNTVSGRPAALDGVEEMVGLFINTLPVRVRVRGDARLGSWLAELQRAQAEAREYEYAPLVQVQGWSEVPRGTPLFESQFVFENYPVERGAGGGAGVALRATRGRAVEWTTYPLSLMAAPGPRLQLVLRYDEARFGGATVERMLDHLRVLLEQVAEDVDRPLSALTLLGEAERRTVVEEWNRTAAPFPADRCIHQLFEAQAARTPDAVAVTFGGGRMTYGELDAWSNRLARHLRRLGVGPEVRVGLCLERGLEMMPAILGVMKAGGAYVPVDPAHPAERIGYVLADSGVAVLLTQERLRNRLFVRDGVEVIAVDAAWKQIATESAEPVESGITAENLAYVIYTSGSTGRPKGVAMHHRGVSNYIAWGVEAYGADAGSGAPVFSSMAVDLTITNLLPLFCGHTAHFLPEDNALEALAQALREGPRYGLIKITPTHLSLLTPLLTPEQAQNAAATLVIGADFLPAEPTVWWQENAPGVRLMNEYGPTETVVGCSAYVLPNGVHRHGPVPVGGPIANLTFYVLDAHLQPAPIGVAGELYIGGAGVARGYLGRPGLTAEKFIPDPFGPAGERVYRTGDRARWMEGGTLMILGRTDNQVKVRGYRVELGEIEAVLRRHDAVSGAITVVREDVPGDRRLVAYVVSDAEPAILREYLRGTLPEYMVPGAFVRLETLPATATGKVDPKTLPAPEYVSAEAEHVPPRTPVEAALAEIWAEVLGVERVGATDNFFALGGHSILAIQVMSHVREIFGMELPLRTLFDTPVLGELAWMLANDPRYAAATERVVELMLRVEQMTAETVG